MRYEPGSTGGLEKTGDLDLCDVAGGSERALLQSGDWRTNGIAICLSAPAARHWSLKPQRKCFYTCYLNRRGEVTLDPWLDLLIPAVSLSTRLQTNPRIPLRCVNISMSGFL